MSTMMFISFIALQQWHSEQHINANNSKKNMSENIFYIFFYIWRDANKKKRWMLWNQMKSDTTIHLHSEIYTTVKRFSKCNFKIPLKRFFYFRFRKHLNEQWQSSEWTNKQTTKNCLLIKKVYVYLESIYRCGLQHWTLILSYCKKKRNLQCLSI